MNFQNFHLEIHLERRKQREKTDFLVFYNSLLL